MQKLKKLLGEFEMTWPRVILFAVMTAVYTAGVMLVPPLKDTSFQDIGVTVECWVVFAVIIVVNCRRGWEAALKCFVFFLISQPLIYALQLPFGGFTLQQAVGYYMGLWFWATLLTLPGGFIAFYCKKQTVAGAVILGLGNTLLMGMGAYYGLQAAVSFPRHLLSAVFCLCAAVALTLGIQPKTKHRVIALSLPVVLVLAVAVAAKCLGRTFLF